MSVESERILGRTEATYYLLIMFSIERRDLDKFFELFPKVKIFEGQSVSQVKTWTDLATGLYSFDQYKKILDDYENEGHDNLIDFPRKFVSD